MRAKLGATRHSGSLIAQNAQRARAAWTPAKLQWHVASATIAKLALHFAKSAQQASPAPTVSGLRMNVLAGSTRVPTTQNAPSVQQATAAQQGVHFFALMGHMPLETPPNAQHVQPASDPA